MESKEAGTRMDTGDVLLDAVSASKLVGGIVSPQCIREHMKRGIVDLGTVMPPLNGSKRQRYLISKKKLYRWLGIE